MIDARRDEVYTGLYSVQAKEHPDFPELKVCQKAQPCVPDEKFQIKIQDQKVLVFRKCGISKEHSVFLN